MRVIKTDPKVIGFLESYPDYSPLPEQISHMTASVRRGLTQDKYHKLNLIDIVFALLFVPVLLVLLSAEGSFNWFWLPGLAQWSSINYLQVLLVYLLVAIPPMLLVILPLNNRR